MIVLLDNYDSFTYNLYQYLMECHSEVEVFRNDKIDAETLISMNPQGIVISPGPGHPQNAGNCPEILKKVDGKIRVLGVCLGHQLIGMHFGMDIVHAKKIFHGKTSLITNDGKSLFSGLEKEIEVGRYHSLTVDRKFLPDFLEISAETLDDKTIMGIRHKNNFMEGIQFHPESILTPTGKQMIKNFVNSLP